MLSIFFPLQGVDSGSESFQPAIVEPSAPCIFLKQSSVLLWFQKRTEWTKKKPACSGVNTRISGRKPVDHTFGQSTPYWGRHEDPDIEMDFTNADNLRTSLHARPGIGLSKSNSNQDLCYLFFLH